MIFKNKICILINWSREIDMYNELINSLPEDKLDIIVNDLKTSEEERSNNVFQIKANLKKKKISFKYFSSIYKKTKYKVVISTGFAHSSKVSIYTFLKFLYGKTIGQAMDIFGISKIFMYLFARPLNGGGRYSKIGSYGWYPEKDIGEKSIRYPSGMDLKLRYYPQKILEKNFDIFFTHSKMEAKLIKKKFKNKICKIIGYPRYNKLDSKKNIIFNLKKEFNLNLKKKIIFWTPTHIYFPNETSKNFYPWIEYIEKLKSEFNIIIRPHPKLINKDKTIIKILKKKNFFVDDLSDRKIGELYKISDIVVCDYGGTIFSAIYLKKPIILLNLHQNSEFLKQQKLNFSLDILIRKEIINLDLGISFMEFKKSFLKATEHKEFIKICKLNNKFFGMEKDYESTNKISKYILNYLK